MGYKTVTFKGVSWIGSLRFITRIVSFIKIAILARILGPVEFGLFGIATLVLSFLEIITDTGINVFLIQEKEDIKKYLDTAWIVSIIRGIVISALILVFAPFVISFFKSSGYQVLILASLVPFIRGFINPSVVTLQKDLHFGKEFRYRLSIFTFDAFVAVVVSIYMHSAIGLIWGLVAGALLELVLSFIIVKPFPKIRLDTIKFKKVINRGKWLTLAGFFTYLFEHGDDIIVGKLLGQASLGIYQQAYKISTLPISEIADVANKVTFPIYTRISDDLGRLKSAFKKTSLVIGILVIPFGLAIYFFSSQFVSIILGDKWLAAVDVLKVLTIYAVFRAVVSPSISVYLALKRQDLVSKVAFIGLLGLFISIIPLTKRFGIIGAGISPIIGTLVSLPFIVFFTRKLLTVNKDQK